MLRGITDFTSDITDFTSTQVHWRAFVEGRFPKPAKLEPESRLPAAAAAAAAGAAASPPAAAESVGSGGLHTYVLSEAGTYADGC